MKNMFFREEGHYAKIVRILEDNRVILRLDTGEEMIAGSGRMNLHEDEIVLCRVCRSLKSAKCRKVDIVDLIDYVEGAA